MPPRPSRAAKSAAPVTRFKGFSRAAPGFFHELAVEMNRDWFLANKARYQEQWVAPMTALLTQVAAKLAPTYKPLKLGEPKVMRIHRDVRFSKNKAPYKTHVGGVVTLAGKKLGEGGTAAMYVHLGADEEFIGVGTYQFDAAKLARWRKAVAHKDGELLMKLVTRLRRAGYTVSGHDDYKKVPRGFHPDHPRAELLKMKGLTASPAAIPRGMLHQAAFATWLVKHGRALAPLVTWLHRKVG